MTRIAGVWAGTVQVGRSIRIVRGPLLAALFIGCVLSMPDQLHDLYRVDLDDLLDGEPLRPLLGLLGVLACSGVIWLLARRLVQSIPAETEASLGRFRSLLAAWPAVCGVIIPAALALGLERSARQHGASSEFVTHDAATESAALARDIAVAITTSTQLLRVVALVLIGLTILAAGLGIWRAVRSSGAPQSVANRTQPTLFGPTLFGPGPFAAAVAITLALVVLFAFGPVEASEATGTIIVIAAFGMLMAYFLSLLLHVSDRHGVPALSLLIGAAVLFSYLDINDNHRVELVDAKPRHDLFGADAAFQAWYQARGDRADYEARGEPYPVYIVSAAGGGLYAAHQAATFLARMQDRCPSFAQHVFALSGVSGGSLGSAVFQTLARQPHLVRNGPARPCAKGPLIQGPLERKVSAFFAHDLLAPVVAATLFPDVLQRFLPFPVPRFDRTRALEASFAAVSQRELEDGKSGAPPDPFARSFLEHWEPSGAAPALFLNGTQVNNGHRVISAPFWRGNLFDNESKATWLQGQLQGETKRGDVTLATAVGLSARFPFMLPAGRIVTTEGEIRVLDGALFDNSGIETAMDLVEQLDDARALRKSEPGAGPAWPNVKIHVLVISSRNAVDPKDSPFLSETMAAVQALSSTSNARADFGILRARSRLCAGLGGCPITVGEATVARDDPSPLQEVGFYAQDFQLPLGWRLSRTSQKTIDLIVGRSHECSIDDQRRPRGASVRDLRVRSAIKANACIAAWVEHQLASKEALREALSEAPPKGTRKIAP